MVRLGGIGGLERSRRATTYLAELGGCVDIFLDGFQNRRVFLENEAVGATTATLQRCGGRFAIGQGSGEPRG